MVGYSSYVYQQCDVYIPATTTEAANCNVPNEVCSQVKNTRLKVKTHFAEVACVVHNMSL